MLGILIDTIDNMVAKVDVEPEQFKDYLNCVYCSKPLLTTNIQKINLKNSGFNVAIVYNLNAMENTHERASSFLNDTALTYGTIFIVGYDGLNITSLGGGLINYILDHYITNKYGKKCLVIKEEKKKKC